MFHTGFVQDAGEDVVSVAGDIVYDGRSGDNTYTRLFFLALVFSARIIDSIATQFVPV